MPIATGTASAVSREQEADGWVAEVIFPNTQPPFAPMARSQLEAPPLVDDIEHRWAGLRAHNRWLADYVSLAPERHAGCAQIYLGDVEGSVAEIEWAAEHNLRAASSSRARRGSGFLPLYAAEYEPIWAACEANEMPVQPPQRRRYPRFRHAPARVHRHVHARGHAGGRTARCGTSSSRACSSGIPTCTSCNTESGTTWVPRHACPSSTASTTA